MRALSGFYAFRDLHTLNMNLQYVVVVMCAHFSGVVGPSTALGLSRAKELKKTFLFNVLRSVFRQNFVLSVC